MKIVPSNLLTILLFLISCSQVQNKNIMNSNNPKFTNHLVHESSPYLLQHAHNPVNWYPWGKEALEKAQKENKLIIVSIGYAACHWCHVMEHESFEDEEVAKFMNEHFVSIKIDREERPDIDQVYMNAVQLLSGRGGWPLNCIALPDGRPIYGGTYFPKAQWMDMLTKVSEFVKKNPDKAEEQAQALTEGIKASELVLSSAEKTDFTKDDLSRIFSVWKRSIDYKNGGYDRAPKFPLPVGYQFLLHYHHLLRDPEALEAVTSTLTKMANGGIYDQIGGGFSRYSTDEYWLVPHFEKMLYDNAQLVSLYAEAYRLTKNQQYKSIVTQTLTFIQRELTSPEGGFYSSLDADSEGEEGKFYVWNAQELKSILGPDANVIMDYYNVIERGNWEEGKNILNKSGDDKAIADKHKITLDELYKQVLTANETLLTERAKRIRPGLDDKVLTSWNALMIKAYVDAYRTFDDERYLKSAIKTARFILTKIKSGDHRLTRNYKNGKASINAFLDDYAFTIQAFIALYRATFDEHWLTEAKYLTEYALTHFYDESTGMFYYTSDIDPPLIARKMEISDNVIAASNSEMAKNLYILGLYYYKDEYMNKAKQMLANVKQGALQGGVYYANWDILMAWLVQEPYEVAIVGENYDDLRKEIDAHYLPDVLLVGGKNEGTLAPLENKLIKGQTTIYVCQNKTCKLPVTSVTEALKQIR